MQLFGAPAVAQRSMQHGRACFKLLPRISIVSLAKRKPLRNLDNLMLAVSFCQPRSIRSTASSGPARPPPGAGAKFSRSGAATVVPSAADQDQGMLI